MKSILYIPNFKLNSDNHYQLDLDQNTEILKTIIRLFKKFQLDNEFKDQYRLKILIPKKETIESKTFSNEIMSFSDSNFLIEFFNFELPTNPIMVDYSKIKDLKYNYDIIFNCIPELAVILKTVFGKEQYVISINDIVSDPKNDVLFLRKFESMVTSNVNLYTDELSMMKWMEHIFTIFTPSIDDLIKNTQGAFLNYIDTNRKIEEMEKFEQHTTLYVDEINNESGKDWYKIFALYNDDAIKSRVIIYNADHKKLISFLENTKDNDYVKGYHHITIQIGNKTIKCLSAWHTRILIVNEKIDKDIFLNLCKKSHSIISFLNNEYNGILFRNAIIEGSLLPIVSTNSQYKDWFNETKIELDELNPININKYLLEYNNTVHNLIVENIKYDQDYMKTYNKFCAIMEDAFKSN